jgi:hypothetical protein
MPSSGQFITRNRIPKYYIVVYGCVCKIKVLLLERRPSLYIGVKFYKTIRKK